MLPGDSLVDKIFEEGLKEAQAVIVVLSRISVEKPWVREVTCPQNPYQSIAELAGEKCAQNALKTLTFRSFHRQYGKRPKMNSATSAHIY